jgi:DUF971 family protein
MTRWPTELTLAKDKRALTIRFEDGVAHTLSAEYLRVMSPSAEVQVGGKQDVMILNVIPVGNYAVRLTFDDMHSTGIFGWDYLDELGREHAERWESYLAELAAKGMKRGR